MHTSMLPFDEGSVLRDVAKETGEVLEGEVSMFGDTGSLLEGSECSSLMDTSPLPPLLE